jgi:hypothetical protein
MSRAEKNAGRAQHSQPFTRSEAARNASQSADAAMNAQPIASRMGANSRALD